MSDDRAAADSPHPIAEAAVAARRGALIVIPTDTVYGIATRPDDPRATSRLFAAKGRPPDLALPVLAASLDVARELAALDERAERVAAALWPGALTLVLPRAAATRAWELGGTGATIALRVPRHPLAIAVLEHAGALAASSANRSGEPPARTCEELERTFEDMVEVYICEERKLAGEASTVVDLSGSRPRILRAGGLDPGVLEQLWAEETRC
jgi:tRNA threonylcarbamoyl adenosine modification protein (Sua5/YciO/YrdC/YwlC family)